MLANRLSGTALAPFGTLTRELDRMFDGVFDAPVRGRFPAVSIWEDDEAFHLEAVVPGVAADDLDIRATGNQVTLKGKRAERTRDGARLHRSEFRAVEFERSFELPVDIDGQAITAELDQGILQLTLPKAPEHKPVKIQVRKKDEA